MTNSRSISLLMIFSKVLEKDMYNRLSHHLHANNVLVPEQFRFMWGISTEHAFWRGGIFCDLAIAFDCLNYEILLAKLHFYGIQGTISSCFRFYLADRKQKTEIKPSNATQNCFSNWGKNKTWSSPRVCSRGRCFS
jgi:hypothetical protein